MRVGLVSVLAALALAGCGGEGAGAGESAAAVVPSGTLGFVEVDVDLESDQWSRVQDLLDRFPDRPQLMELLNEQARESDLEYERDIAPALGDTVAFVFNGSEEDDVVVLTQPDDDAKYEALIANLEEESGEEVVTGEVDGWRAAAESQASIDALGEGGASLADDDAFEAALAEAPEDRLAFGFVRGDFADSFGGYANTVDVEWAAGAVEARENGPVVDFTIRGEGASTGEAYASERLEQAPADALAFLSFDGEALRSRKSMLGPLADVLGVRLEELLEGVNGEGALWVRLGGGMPEVTLVVGVDDADGAREALEPLLQGLPLEVRMGVVDGRLVATTASSPEEAVRPSGETLADSEDFREAADAAGMPDETSGFLYVNVADALPLLGLAGLAGAELPGEVVENLRPIRSVVAWSESDGDTTGATLFVHIQ